MMAQLCLIVAVCCALLHYSASATKESCRFARDFKCEDFLSLNADEFVSDNHESTQKSKTVDAYLRHVMHWERNFAVSGVGLEPNTMFTFDGHPLNYTTGGLYGSPHTFSAPSKESLHVALLALSLQGNEYAREFAGGLQSTISMLYKKIDSYEKFNKNFPGFGCFTPWVTFDDEKGIVPLPDWANRVPALDNGEWFWALFAVQHVLESQYASQYGDLAARYAALVKCQSDNVKTIFYRGEGRVSAVVTITDTSLVPSAEMYTQEGSGLLDDPYEGETVAQMLYLFSTWDSEEEREMLWTVKRPNLRAVNYVIPKEIMAHKSFAHLSSNIITVQQGYWFSSHEQWKLLLLPYLSKDLPIVRKIFRNAEKARTIDAHASHLPGLLASINDVTDGSEDIPCYASACGISSIASQVIERRDIMTPYGSFPIFLQDIGVGLCWYNNMLRGPRMQSAYGSTEAINANSTEISPLTTWDSKITTVVAILQGVAEINQGALLQIKDSKYGTSYHRFVHAVQREHSLVFGTEADVKGGDVPFALPNTELNFKSLSDWDLACA